MATYYWVGGSGTWGATTTTYLATSLGGASGTSVFKAMAAVAT